MQSMRVNGCMLMLMPTKCELICAYTCLVSIDSTLVPRHIWCTHLSAQLVWCCSIRAGQLLICRLDKLDKLLVMLLQTHSHQAHMPCVSTKHVDLGGQAFVSHGVMMGA